MPKLIKPWSISTTVRNPERLRGFLAVLAQMEGMEWEHDSQIGFQIRLLQARLYGVFSKQFYSNLSPGDIRLLESTKDISYSRAKAIFWRKGYEDAAMRGRNSFKPLQKFGFADINSGKIRITSMGKAFLTEQDDYGEIFLRSLLKWQLPNPVDIRGFPRSHGYNIKPFVGVLRLIDEVNRLCRAKNMKEKGLSRREFEAFALTLINYAKIKETANKIVNLRERISGISAQKRSNFFEEQIKRLCSDFNIENARDYADNAIRYFRMTKYIRLRGWGDHIDIEPSRKYEIESLFRRDNASPSVTDDEYTRYLTDINQPDLPGETKDELEKTVTFLKDSIRKQGETPTERKAVTQKGLKSLRDDLRKENRELINQREKIALKNPQTIRGCATELRSLTRGRRGTGKPSVALEWLTARGLWALNDAIEISPNYPLGDDGLPAHHAPAGKADIECFYSDFVAICEVTLLRDSKQWMHEAQPVMRHMHEFQGKHQDADAYCIFIAPSLHNDTINAFRMSSDENYGYEGVVQKIAPLSLEQFCQILDFCADRQEAQNPITREEMKCLLTQISESICRFRKSDVWRESVSQIIEQWQQN